MGLEHVGFVVGADLDDFSRRHRAVLTGQQFQSSTKDRKSTRLNSSHERISYAVFCLKATIAVPLNTLFGLACAVVLVRHRFPGRNLLDAFVDLPFAVSPAVIGLALVLVYFFFCWFGGRRALHSFPTRRSSP